MQGENVFSDEKVHAANGSPLVPPGFVIFWYAFFCYFMRRWRDLVLRGFSFEYVPLVAAGFVVPASYHCAFCAVRG
jgi:hypothetical protein